MNDDREHRVRTRAYALWESEGRPADRHEEHWHRANSEFEQDAPAPSEAEPQDAPPPSTPQPKASRRKPAAASPAAVDAPSAVQESAPTPPKRRTLKPKAR